MRSWNNSTAEGKLCYIDMCRFVDAVPATSIQSPQEI